MMKHLNGLAFITLLCIIFGLKLRVPLLIIQFSLAVTLGYFFDLFDRAIQFMIGDAIDEKIGIDSDAIAQRARKLSWSRLYHITPLSHSFWFLVAYFPLSIFVISSTGSIVGMGVILGLGIRYSLILIHDLSNQTITHSVFFSESGVKFDKKELTKLAWGFVVGFMIMVLLVGVRL